MGHILNTLQLTCPQNKKDTQKMNKNRDGIDIRQNNSAGRNTCLKKNPEIKMIIKLNSKQIGRWGAVT